ncbi:MAG: GMC family oxidoreductase [Myxococcota bacterium]
MAVAMDRVIPLAERWLRAHGDPDPAGSARSGADRASRYPAPIGALWPQVLAAFDRVAPLAVLGRPTRAHRLDDDAFDAVDRGLQHHPNRVIRLAWLLARAPLIDARYPEAPPPSVAHPLDALRDTIAARRSLRNDRFDVIVIGTGAGGAPVGWALASAGLSVAFVEAGDLVGATTAGAAVEQHYVDQGMFGSAAGGGTALVVAGRAVGGTTAINSGTSFRPLPEQLAAWDRSAGTRFADGALDGYLATLNDRLGIAPVPEAMLDGSSRLVRDGLARIGRTGAHPLPRNAPGCVGSGRCCFGCPTGAKLSTDRAFLPDAVAAGATLLARTEAIGVRTGPDGVDVWVRSADGVRRLRARHLIVSAGAVWTPGLLRTHRIGERWRRAGDDLRIHPASKVFGWMPEALPGHGVPQAMGYRAPELPRVTFEGAHTPPTVTATLIQAAGRRHRAWMEHHDHLANYGLMIRDRSTGSVRSVLGRPVLRYALHEDDVRDIGASLIIAAEALFAAGAERVAFPIAGDDPECGSRAELAGWTPERFTRGNLLTSGFHPQGTAGIGRVVDPDLRVIGEEAVSVCDASVLPDSPGVNPQITIMALSLRLADRLLEEGRWGSARAK